MILQALCGYYDRLAMNPNADIPLLGYARTNVSSCIVIDREGDVKAIRPLMDSTGKKPRPVQLVTPEQPKRAGQRPQPAFLCENANFIFGICDNPLGAEYRFNASKEIHEKVLSCIEDDGAAAILRFFNKRKQGCYDIYGVDPRPLEEIGNIIFQLKGDEQYLHDRPAIKEAWENYRARLSGKVETSQCLISGLVAPVARLHGNISGFGQDKPTLVGFNQNSFVSYGKEQGMNAPVSETAMFKYTTALNLLVADRKHRINLNGDKIVFWAERDAIEEELVAAMFFDMDVPSANSGLDEDTCQMVKATASALLGGKKPSDLKMDPGVRFYMLGMSANRTRLVIRFFHTDTFGSLVERVKQHYDDIGICGRDIARPSPYRLARETAVRRDSENVAPNMEGALLRSILGGTIYPYSIFQQMMVRVRAEAAGDPKKNGGHAFSRERVGFIKGYLNRAMRREGKNNEEMMTVALNESERSTGYLLGRLMALLEKAQKDAIPGVNASIVDKYLNSALATPQMVFPMLLTLSKKHIAKVDNYYMDRRIGELMSCFPSTGFPETLNAEEQGKFMIGYYHQNQALYTKRNNSKTENTEEE